MSSSSRKGSNHKSKSTQQPPEELRSIKDVLQKFGLLTSVRGVPRILKSRNILWRVLWTGFVMFFFVTSTYQVLTLIQNYYGYPKKQWQEIQTGVQTSFPAVTLCNLHSLGSKWDSLKSFSNYNLSPKEYFEKVSNYIPHMAENLDVWDHLLSTTGYYQNIEYDVAKRYGPNHEDLIVLCELKLLNGTNTVSIPCKNYIVDSAQFFNCYTVSADEEQQKKVIAIDIILYLDDFSTDSAPAHLLSDFQSQMHGAKVTIHPYGSYPDISTDGLDVYPGTSVHFRFETRHWQHLNFPLGSCDEIPHDMLIKDEHGEEFEYSLWHCHQLCQQRYIIKQCGCRSADIPVSDTDNILGLQYCAYLDENVTLVQERLRCLANIGLNLNEEGDKNDNCDCPHPCNYYKYPSTMTMSRWPHASFQLAFYDIYIKNHKHKKKTYPRQFDVYGQIQEMMKTNKTKAFEMLRNTDMIDRNFVRIGIQRPDYHVTVIREKLEITGTQLVSSIGGAFSFWLGITVVTVVEIMELIYDLLCLALCRDKSERHSSTPMTRTDSKNSSNGGRYTATAADGTDWPT